MSNPALNPKIFQKETAANEQPGAFEPGWGAPADELPPNVFDAQAGAAGMGATRARPPVSAGTGDTMRISGTMTATAILLLLLMVAGYFGWQALDLHQTGVTPAG